MRLPFTQVDAFAAEAFQGNPAAVIPLSAWLPDDTLQAIAEENNLSETAFIIPADGDADLELRWFTPAVEVALCGHATLASGHVVLQSEPTRDKVTFRTRQAGLLEVARDGIGYAMALPAYRAEPRELPAVLAGLGLTQAVETRWHPGRYALVVLDDEEAVRGLRPDFRALAAEGDILTIATAPGRDTDVVSRVFACGAGIDEDPVTGSAHSVLTPYWTERLGRDRFTAFQASRRGGRLTCRAEGDRVVLGGQCVTVIEGTFLLP
ncbi:PhzF family phenazine biosynthesis protein [Sphingomonas lenta]|uniref:PhzF family phenazine biosynthesis protein n=1 Tax=Sphingomonas lenta TaxID=1141887 RepID=A0A2A2SCW1_9SPHN|nr:PhzF family phenazine biosynthesis protein [Sphingomonas lenta]PAX07089.1 PhzF family phenazine biosynthesis protein [Sphingomonas lenta]